MNYIRIKLNQTDISDYQNWQLDIYDSGNWATLYKLDATKSNNSSKDYKCSSSFNSITQIRITATTNILSMPTLTAETGTFSGTMDFGDSSLERIIDMTSSDWSAVTSTSVLSNTVKTLKLSDVITYQEPKPKVTIDARLTHCTISPSDTEIEIDGQSHVLTLTPDTGYLFETVPTINIDDDITPFNADGNKYTIDLDNLGITSDVTAVITAVAVEQPKYPDTVNIVFSLTNGSVSSDSDTTIDNTTSSRDVVVSVKADDGYIFNTLPILTINFDDDTTTQYELSYNNARDSWDCDTGVFAKHVVSANVSGTADEKTIVESNYGMFNIYQVTTNDLAELSRIRFIQSSASSEYIDLAKYIINIYKYPFNMTLGANANIRLGYYSTSINVPKVSHDTYIFESEPIDVLGLYNNASDILHSNIRIYLPWHGYEPIDSKYINTSIKVSVKVNIITNECIYSIYSDDNLIMNVNDNIGDIMPYILKSNDTELTVNSQMQINLFENKMFIEVLQNAKVENTRYTQSKVTQIENLDGFNRCNILGEISISNAMQDEITELKQIIETGFYI